MALGRPGEELDGQLRTAVSFALSVLLSENINRVRVLDRLRLWQGAERGSQHHTMAVHVITSMSGATFPPAGAPALHRVRLADLLIDHVDQTFPLVVTALDDPATYEAMVAGLLLIERDPALRRQTDLSNLLAALGGVARRHRGVLRFVLRRHRAHNSPAAEGFVS